MSNYDMTNLFGPNDEPTAPRKPRSILELLTYGETPEDYFKKQHRWLDTMGDITDDYPDQQP